MKRRNKIRLNEAQLHRIIKESVAKILSEYEQELIRDSINESLNEALYNNWSDFKRGAKNTAMSMALAGSMAAPMASCQSNPSSQQQQTPQVEYTQQITPVDQMGMAPESLYVVGVHRTVILAHELHCSVVAYAMGISQFTQVIVSAKFIGEY